MSSATEDQPPVDLPSVWAAFDRMQLCYTAIPQIKHYYRHGTLRDCSQDRQEFMFALSLKQKSRQEAEKLVRERQDSKYNSKVYERSSRNVWKLRTEPPTDFPPA